MAKTLDITRAARALGAAKFANSAVMIIAGMMLFAAIASVFSGQASFGVPVLIALALVLPVVVFGLNGMHPLVGLVVALGYIYVAYEMVRFSVTIDPHMWPGIVYSEAATGYRALPTALNVGQFAYGGLWFVLAAFPAWAYLRAITLSRELRRMARPLAPIKSPLALFRETFGVWPGFRRRLLPSVTSRAAMSLSALLQYGGIGFLFFEVVTLIVFAVAVGVRIAALGDAAAWINRALYWSGWFALGFVIVCAPLVLAGLLRMFARAMARQSLAGLVERDGRPGTLFLRSFQDDQVTLPPAAFAVRLSAGELGKRRLDHILVEQFSRYGPIIALGKPGEKQLPFGAARIYAEHDQWQKTVENLAEKAAFIVLVADPSPGVAWEIERMLDERHRAKVLFLSPPRRGGLHDVPSFKDALPEPSRARAIAAYTNRENEFIVLQAKGRARPEVYQVALQAYFRDRI